MPPRASIPNGSSSLSASNPSDDICPVCKSNRYLNPNLRFLINPECYHKMCSTCVDRIFTSGPASCPVPYCGKTLRKKGFHTAFFADLAIEREVDIRKRVGAVFNRRQDEFETLMDWNNYLEEVESLIFDLVEGTREEKLKAEEKIRAYREGNKGEIEENQRYSAEEIDLARRREREEKEAARQRRLAAYREEEEEKADLQKTKMDILDRLATSNEDANMITQQAQRVVLKKTSAKRSTAGAQQSSNGSGREPGLTINLRGLKQKKAPIIEKPYDPFGGIDLTPSRYSLQPDYDNEWLANAKSDLRHVAGGYSLDEYYARTMFEAFSGLGVFIADEIIPQNEPASSAVGTTAAAEAAGGKVKLESKMELDDVF